MATPREFAEHLAAMRASSSPYFDPSRPTFPADYYEQEREERRRRREYATGGAAAFTPLSAASGFDLERDRDDPPAAANNNNNNRRNPLPTRAPPKRHSSGNVSARKRTAGAYAPMAVFAGGGAAAAAEAVEDNSMIGNELASVAIEPPAPLVVHAPEVDEVTRRLGKLHLGSGNCFACRYARDSTMPPITKQGVTEMYTLYRTYPAGANKVDIALELEEFFEHQVRAKANRQIMEGETPCPQWHADSIYEHFFTPLHGRIDSLTSVEMRAWRLEMIFYAKYTHNTWERRDTENGESVLVPRSDRDIETLTKLSSAIDRTYQLKPSSLSLASTNAPAVGRSAGFVDTSRRRRIMGKNPPKRL
jgi:hypothetical protein